MTTVKIQKPQGEMVLTFHEDFDNGLSIGEALRRMADLYDNHEASTHFNEADASAPEYPTNPVTFTSPVVKFGEPDETGDACEWAKQRSAAVAD